MDSRKGRKDRSDRYNYREGECAMSPEKKDKRGIPLFGEEEGGQAAISGGENPPLKMQTRSASEKRGNRVFSEQRKGGRGKSLS